MLRTQRDTVDYGLARRAALTDLFAGRASTMDVCDAHPYLLRAAKYHGEPTVTPCPVCKKGPLIHVTYTYWRQAIKYVRVAEDWARSAAR